MFCQEHKGLCSNVLRLKMLVNIILNSFQFFRINGLINDDEKGAVCENNYKQKASLHFTVLIKTA